MAAPALLTRVSMRPKRSSAASTIRPAAAGSVMSPATVSRSGSSDGLIVRALATTAQVRPRYPATRPAPMPAEAPVMMATLWMVMRLRGRSEVVDVDDRLGEGTRGGLFGHEAFPSGVTCGLVLESRSRARAVRRPRKVPGQYPGPRAGPPQAARPPSGVPGQPRPGRAARGSRDVRWLSGCEDVPAVRAAARAHVDEVVGGGEQVQVVVEVAAAEPRSQRLGPQPCAVAHRAHPGDEETLDQAAGALVVASQGPFHRGDRVVVVHRQPHAPPVPARLQGHLPLDRLAMQHDVALMLGQ